MVHRPMTKSETQEQLKAVLTGLPDRYIEPFVSAVEFDRLAGGSLPHSLIIESLRPALKNMGVARFGTPTPLRLFCEPFEDILFSGPVHPKSVGRISRLSIAPVWEWLAELIPDAHKDLSDLIVKQILSRQDGKLQEATSELLRTAANALDAIFLSYENGSPEYLAMAKRLGSEAILEDARDMGSVLKIADYGRQIKGRFARPIDRLDEDDFIFVRKAYDELTERYPQQSKYLVYLLMGRMGKPWHILSVLPVLCRTKSEDEIRQSELGEIGDQIFDDIETLATEIASTDYLRRGPAQGLNMLTNFVEASRGITRQMSLKRDGHWGKRLFEARRRVAHAMEHQLNRSVDTIIETFPTVKMGAFGDTGAGRPDLTEAPASDDVERAAKIAMFIDRTRTLAADAAFGKHHKEASDRVQQFILGYGADMVQEVRAGNHETINNLQAHLEATVKITGLLVGEEEADLFLRRATTAARN